MERFISPTVERPEEWESVLATEGLARKFGALVDSTLETKSAAELGWTGDRENVAGRWQHLVEYLGHQAAGIGHPLFHPDEWADLDYVDYVMGNIEPVSDDASHVERALVLTHSQVMMLGMWQRPGISVKLCRVRDSSSILAPATVELMTSIYDLRDMGEPEKTIIGDMGVDEYRQLYPSGRRMLHHRVENAVHEHPYGIRYSQSRPLPQQARYLVERDTLDTFDKLVEFGTTDPDEIADIRDRRMDISVTFERGDNPYYGKVPNGMNYLTERQQWCVQTILGYLLTDVRPHEAMAISRSVMNRLEIGITDIQTLMNLKILPELKNYTTPEGPQYRYRLADSYREYVLGRRFPARE